MPAAPHCLFQTWFVPALVALLLAACGGAPQVSAEQREAQEAAYEKAKALFEEKCRTVAGEKIHRKVEGVEGVLLMKVRPAVGDRQWKDRMWPGAAFARETFGDGYINSFLGYEYSSSSTGEPVSPQRRGYINVARYPGGLPGYRFVDVIDEKDGRRYRYTGRYDEPWKRDPERYSRTATFFVLERIEAPDPAPRYAVDYEDHVIPEEREMGLASTTIRVIDRQTGEILGEMLRYAWSRTGPSKNNPVPWLTAIRCPSRQWTGADTRQFVDQVLIPARDR